MNRRSIVKGCAATVAGVIGMFGLKAIAGDGLPKPIPPEEVARLDKANLPFRQGPTMDQLINGANHGTGDRKYANKVLDEALFITGAVAYGDGGDVTPVYYSPRRIPVLGACGAFRFPTAYATLVPVSVLKHIPLAKRGDGFPRGIPFVELH